MNNIKELLENSGIIPFRAGTTHGGEYHSSCPGCGDGAPRSREQGPSDRFQIWPEKPEGVVYYCRKCGKHGDCIQFLRDFDGKTYLEACAILGITPSGTQAAKPLRTASTPQPPKPIAPQVFAAHTPDLPSEAWMTKAGEFAAWCHEQLIVSDEGQQMLASRGLTLDTAIRYRIGYNPGENGSDLRRARKAWGLPDAKNSAGKPKALWLPRGLVMPLIAQDGRVIQLRIRRRPEDVAAFATNLPYQLIEGSCHATMVLEPTAKAFVVTESGLCAYLCAQEGHGLVGAVTTWNSAAKPDAAACAVLDRSMRILAAQDNDAPGAKASLWWLERFPQARRWPVPVGKDPGEAKAAGCDLRKWLMLGLPPALTIAVDPHAPIVDRVDLACSVEGGAENEAGAGGEEAEKSAANEGEKQEMVDAGGVGHYKADVAELAGLLATHPVRVLKSKDGHEVRIQWQPAWRHANQTTANRISDLVFRSEQVGLAIHRHPAMVLHGGNMLSGAKI
jgi:hypothetical protein